MACTRTLLATTKVGPPCAMYLDSFQHHPAGRKMQQTKRVLSCIAQGHYDRRSRVATQGSKHPRASDEPREADSGTGGWLIRPRTL